MSTQKIRLQLEGLQFQLPSETLRTTMWGGAPCTPYIDLSAKHVASLMKQYVKAKYPQIHCSANSDSYSGGDSVRVYLSTQDGYSVSDSIENDVNKFSYHFEEGKFNGMIDMYEYSDTKMYTENGTEIRGGTKYVFVENRPMFGSVPDICRMLRDYQNGLYIGGVKTLAQSIVEVMSYHIPSKDVDKALKLMNITEPA